LIIDLLDRPIAYHRCFVTLTGSVTAAVLLSQAVYWSRRTGAGNDGWFWKTGADWEEETGLTRYEQEGARKILRSIGFWEEEKRGIPARLWFRLDLNQLERGLNIAQTSMRKTSKQASGKPANRQAENQQTISENTTETTTPPPPAGGDLLKAFEEILPSERGGHGLLPLVQLATDLGATPEQIRGFPAWAAVNVLRPTKPFFLVKDYLSEYMQEIPHGRLPVPPRENHSVTPRPAAPRESAQQRAARQFAEDQARLQERIRAAEERERHASTGPADQAGQQPPRLHA
jgi:hypothetical protein